MKILWVWVCVLAVLPLSTSASKTKSNPLSKHGRVALLNNPDGEEEEQDWQALEGEGGGLHSLYKMNEGKKEEYYRPFKTRYDLKPFDVNDPDFMDEENRLGYRRFHAANPLHPAQNSRDREAESTVVMMFGFTALATVVCGVYMMNKMNVLDTDSLDAEAYQKLMVQVIAFAALPWLVLGVWLLSVFGGSVSNPMRDSHFQYRWQCSAMTWFLVAAPLLNLVFFTVHAMWISQLFFRIETQPTGAMGRMFSQQAEKKGSDGMSKIINVAVNGGALRHALLIAEVALAICGYMLITFRWGANSQFCHPEVYYATYALVVTAAIIIAFSTLTFIFSILIGVYSTSPWVQDFFGSFWESSILAKMKKEEEQEAAEDAPEPVGGPEPWEQHIQDWQDHQKDLQEDRERHEAIMMEHHSYINSVQSQQPPQHPNAATPREEDPLVIWGDDESQDGAAPFPTGSYIEPATMPRSIMEPTTMPRSMNGSVPGTITTSVIMPPVSSSLAALNAQVYVGPQQAWSSQGFSMPFAQRPSSAPILPSSQGLVTSSGVMMPPTVSTIYTPERPTGYAGFTNSV